jgi:hypothetical protein
MLWRYVEKKVKNSLYPNLYYWSPILPRAIKKSIYKKHGLNIKFEFIPEWWPPYDFFFFFGKIKGYHYPTDDDIKFFYFTLFKKNGFLFILLVLIIYRTHFLELLWLFVKSGITFYLIISLIYLTLFIRKHIRIGLKFLYKVPIKYYPILIIIIINFFLILFLVLKKNGIFNFTIYLLVI